MQIATPLLRELFKMAPAKAPLKTRVWFYQYPGKPEVKIKKSSSGYWIYEDKFFQSIGANTLRGAKEDLIYFGARVYSKLI